MTMVADPNNDQSTHHVIFSPASSPVGLLLTNGEGLFPLIERRPIEDGTIKMVQGQGKHDDLDLPWESIVQQDWGGGVGSKDFDKDGSKYLEGRGVGTVRPGEIILGPMPCYAYGYRFAEQNWPHHDGGSGVTYSAKNAAYVTQPFTPAVNITPAHVYLSYMSTLASNAVPLTVTVTIKADNAGAPGNTIYTGDFQAGGCYEWRTHRVAVSGSGALSAGTQYWITVSGLSSVVFLMTQLLSGGGLKTSADGSTWAAASPAAKLFFRVTDAEKPFRGIFFEYKGILFCLKKFDDGTPSKLYQNGLVGVATGTQSTTTLQDTTKNVAANLFAGSIVYLIGGTGANQSQPWRQIVSNTSNTLAVSPAWDVAPENGVTEYVVVASDRFVEHTQFDTQYDVVSTDALAVNGAVYIANGDAAAMVRLVTRNAAGTWTWDWSDLGGYTAGSAAETGQFSHLLNANGYIYGAKGGVPSTLWKATPVDHTGATGAALIFDEWDAGAGLVGDLGERITGLEQYGETGEVWALKEGGDYAETWNGQAVVFARKSTQEQKASRDLRTGRAHAVMSTYLYHSFHDAILRYYNGIYDAIWPGSVDVPLPYNRRGEWSALVSYPGQLIGAIDGGPNASEIYEIGNYSSIWSYNGQGWHELYRAPWPGMRIQGLYIQSIPGNHVDRLWFVCGSDIMWLPLSIDPYNHPVVNYNFYPYAWGGVLKSSYFYAGMNEIPKYYLSLKLIAELASMWAGDPSGLQVDISASVNDSYGAWTRYGACTTWLDEVDLALAGHRLSLGYHLATGNNSRTPRITTTILKAIKRDTSDHYFTMTALLEDEAEDLLGYPDDVQSWLTKYNRLIALEGQTAPTTVESVNAVLDGKSVFVNKVTLRPYKVILAEGRSGYIVEIQGVEA